MLLTPSPSQWGSRLDRARQGPNPARPGRHDAERDRTRIGSAAGDRRGEVQAEHRRYRNRSKTAKTKTKMKTEMKMTEKTSAVPRTSAVAISASVSVSIPVWIRGRVGRAHRGSAARRRRRVRSIPARGITCGHSARSGPVPAASSARTILCRDSALAPCVAGRWCFSCRHGDDFAQNLADVLHRTLTNWSLA